MTGSAQARRPAALAPDRWSTAIGCAIGAFAVGQAMQAGNGNMQSEAIRWLTLAGFAALVGVVAPTHRFIERVGERAVLVVFGLGLAYQFFQLFTMPPGIHGQASVIQDAVDFEAGLAAAAALTATSLLCKPWLRHWIFPLLLLAFLYLGNWLIAASPDPFIDTYLFQRDAGKALYDGVNPYSIRYPDIYGHSAFYGEGLSVGGVLQFGYPYPPLSLLLTWPVQMALGDYRYAQLGAMALSAACIAYSRPGRVALAAAAFLLFTPRALFVLEQGWTDPFVVLGFSAVTLCALRWKPPLPWVLGLALAVKQYTIFMIPAALHLLPRPLSANRSLVLKAGGIAAAVTVPFVLWGPEDFWRSVVMLQIWQPFRSDSLSYLAWSAQKGPAWPTFLAFVAAAAGLALGLWRQPRTPAGFAATSALTYLAFFAFSKQAFANYYYFTLGVLVVAVAATASGCVSTGWPHRRRDPTLR